MTSMLLNTLSNNRCGECKQCCIVPSIDDPQLFKAEGTPCQNLCDSGCSIYSDRPAVCRGFECLWLSDSNNEELRPDKVGLLSYKSIFGPGLLRIEVVETRQGASATCEGRRWINTLRELTFPTAEGKEIHWPVCVLRHFGGIPLNKRPTLWYVKNFSYFSDLVLQVLRSAQSEAEAKYRCPRNSPCPCGSGLKFKRCHERYVEIIVETEVNR